MTFAEAYKTGRKMRRKGGDNWVTYGESTWVPIYEYIATDWEIEEEQITLTQSQFIDGCQKHLEDVLMARGLSYHSAEPSLKEVVFQAALQYWNSIVETVEKSKETSK